MSSPIFALGDIYDRVTLKRVNDQIYAKRRQNWGNYFKKIIGKQECEQADIGLATEAKDNAHDILQEILQDIEDVDGAKTKIKENIEPLINLLRKLDELNKNNEIAMVGKGEEFGKNQFKSKRRTKKSWTRYCKQYLSKLHDSSKTGTRQNTPKNPLTANCLKIAPDLNDENIEENNKKVRARRSLNEIISNLQRKVGNTVCSESLEFEQFQNDSLPSTSLEQTLITKSNESYIIESEFSSVNNSEEELSSHSNIDYESAEDDLEIENNDKEEHSVFVPIAINNVVSIPNKCINDIRNDFINCDQNVNLLDIAELDNREPNSVHKDIVSKIDGKKDGDRELKIVLDRAIVDNFISTKNNTTKISLKNKLLNELKTDIANSYGVHNPEMKKNETSKTGDHKYSLIPSITKCSKLNANFNKNQDHKLQSTIMRIHRLSCVNKDHFETSKLDQETRNCSCLGLPQNCDEITDYLDVESYCDSRHQLKISNHEQSEIFQKDSASKIDVGICTPRSNVRISRNSVYDESDNFSFIGNSNNNVTPTENSSNSQLNLDHSRFNLTLDNIDSLGMTTRSSLKKMFDSNIDFLDINVEIELHQHSFQNSPIVEQKVNPSMKKCLLDVSNNSIDEIFEKTVTIPDRRISKRTSLISKVSEPAVYNYNLRRPKIKKDNDKISDPCRNRKLEQADCSKFQVGIDFNLEKAKNSTKMNLKGNRKYGELYGCNFTNNEIDDCFPVSGMDDLDINEMYNDKINFISNKEKHRLQKHKKKKFDSGKSLSCTVSDNEVDSRNLVLEMNNLHTNEISKQDGLINQTIFENQVESLPKQITSENSLKSKNKIILKFKKHKITKKRIAIAIKEGLHYAFMDDDVSQIEQTCKKLLKT